MIIKFPNTKKYDAEDLLSRISDEQIFNHFGNLNIKPNVAYNCCFHEDRTPSMYFKRLSDGKLHYTCFGCGAKGDAINFVQELYKITFKESIKLIVDTIEGNENGYIKPTKPTEFKVEPRETVIIPYFRNYIEVDRDYWTQFYITLKTLKKYEVFPCSKVFILGKNDLEINHIPNNPIYAYKMDKDKYKIYRPYMTSKKGKFFSNVDNTYIQGMTQLPEKGDKLFITSSLKDVMVLSELGYDAIAPQSENAELSEKLIDFLYASFKEIYLLYDSDEAGYKFGNKLAEQFGFKPLYIPESYETKDISDFIKKYGPEKARELILNLLNG